MLELGPETPVNKRDNGKHSIPAVQPGVINTDRNKTDYINSADFEAHYKAATSPVSIQHPLPKQRYVSKTLQANLLSEKKTEGTLGIGVEK